MKLFTFILTLFPLLVLAGEPTVEQLFSVQTTKVQQETLSHSKKNYAYVKADDARVYAVSPRFGGFVEKIYANKIYQHVKKGAALLTLYSPEVYKAKEDYLNSYNYTKNRTNKGMLQSAKLKLELLGVSKKEIIQVIKDKKVSKYTTIYAPADGYIFEKNITHGSAFNAKEKLYTLVNLDEVWVEAKVYEDDIVWLQTAKQFSIHTKTTQASYKALSKLLYPKLNPKDATLTLRLQVKNPNNELFPGMYATVVSQDDAQSYLTLPTNAVMRKDGKYYVFVVGEYEGEYEPLEVDAKPLNSHTYIIKEGLSAGDEVVANALFMMDSDAQINGLY